MEKHFSFAWKDGMTKTWTKKKVIYLCLNDDKMFRSACLDCQEELCDASSFEIGYSNFRF